MPQLSSPRHVTLAGFGFGLFGLLIVLAGFGVLAIALHFSRALP